MGDDTGTAIQNQNLIGDDVADEINKAINEQMNTSDSTAGVPQASGPTIVQPTQRHTLPATPLADSGGTVATPDEPALDTKVNETSTLASEDVSETPDSFVSDTPSDDSPLPDTVVQTGTGNFSELQDIKVQALQQLGPLVNHIDQDAEERFNTLIMMIRASDDATLVKPTFDAAKAIEDDKKRAQALLDVVNEVNYLTRPSDTEPSQ